MCERVEMSRAPPRSVGSSDAVQCSAVQCSANSFSEVVAATEEQQVS